MAEPSSPSSSPEREFDVVLFGATGFAGSLTAAALAAAAPAGLRWALAGRDRTKLEGVRAGLAGDVELVHADVTDPTSMAALAARTKVVATTVGPYLEYGEALVRACAEAGTDYCDLTGEPEFVDRMFLRYHETAQGTGARIVHACGFDSIPHDLGVLYAVGELAAEGEVEARGIVRAAGVFSGGTFNSALNQFGRARQMRDAARERRRADWHPNAKVSSSPGRDPRLGYWLLPMPTIDPQVVVRSAAALGEPAGYGASFRYGHYAGVKTLPYAVGGAAFVAGIAAAAQVGPVRRFLGRRVPPGSGPSQARRERSWFTVDVIAESGPRGVHARVSGGDPGYDATATMLAHSALSLATDDLPATSGSVTTATAMGRHLIDRLHPSGIRFETVERW